MTLIHYDNNEAIMELVDEAQAHLLHANLSRANSTVCAHWGATVRTLDPSQSWAMWLRSRMLSGTGRANEVLQEVRKGTQGTKRATAWSAQNTSTAKDTTASSCTARIKAELSKPLLQGHPQLTQRLQPTTK